MKCKHCHKRPIQAQARGLCQKCERWLRYHGRIEEYPKIDLFRDRLVKRYSEFIMVDIVRCRRRAFSLSDIARKYEFSRERASQIYRKLFGVKFSDNG
jgi:hypothetical protein